MKKFLLVLVLVLTLTLSGCREAEEILNCDDDSHYVYRPLVRGGAYCDENDYYTKSEVEELINQELHDFEVSKDYQTQIDNLQPDIYDRFFNYMLSSSDYVFIELNTEYNETVEAYGYSKTYIYEVNETTDFKIRIVLDNDLEFTYYTDYANDDYELIELSPNLFNSQKTYEFTIQEGFLVIEFESWDEEEDSTITFMLSTN
jgi:hypothetical protein